MTNFKFLIDSTIFQSSIFIPLYIKIFINILKMPFVHLRYSLGDHRPSQTNHNIMFLYKVKKTKKLKIYYKKIIFFSITS